MPRFEYCDILIAPRRKALPAADYFEYKNKLLQTIHEYGWDKTAEIISQALQVIDTDEASELMTECLMG